MYFIMSQKARSVVDNCTVLGEELCCVLFTHPDIVSVVSKICFDIMMFYTLKLLFFMSWYDYCSDTEVKHFKIYLSGNC